LVISNVIGVGIFVTPGIVAQMVPPPLGILSVWLAGGILAFAGAGAYAELAALKPLAGGEYVYLREAFGPLGGFLSGWTSFVAGFSGAIAAGAIALAAYLGRYFPAAADPTPLIVVPLYLVRISISPMKIVALAAITAFAALHIRGWGSGRPTQNVLTGIEVLALLALIGLGFTFGTGSMRHLAGNAAPIRRSSWLLALIPVMFTYSGWNAAAYVAEEVREPTRNLPRALALGSAVIVALYLLLNWLYLYALGPRQLAGVVRAGDAAADALFGARGASWLTPLLLVALGAGISAMTVAGPRVYFAMARDRLFPPVFAKVHHRHHTPSAAIAAQAVWSGLLVLTGTFEKLLLYTGFAVVLFSGLAVVGLFLQRRRRRGEGIPFASWGYPVLPALFALSALAMVLNAVSQESRASGAGLAVIAAGLPIYWLMLRRKRIHAQQPENGREKRSEAGPAE